MAKIYFVTNRNPIPNADAPTDFGPNFSSKGIDDLRFGYANVTRRGQSWTVGKITVCKEKMVIDDRERRLGSLEMFGEIQKSMKSGKDTMVFVHGYKVSFKDALIAAAKLKDKLKNRPLNIVVFTWPSDGRYVLSEDIRKLYAYRNDRSDAKASGPAFARGFMKAADFLREIEFEDACRSGIHLMCHSMGNYLLRYAVQEAKKHVRGPLPKLFDHVFLMAADEDYDAFEYDYKLQALPEMCGALHTYFNRDDVALSISDHLKGNPARLGMMGPRLAHNVPVNVSLINVRDAVHKARNDRTGHSYYSESSRVARDVSKVLTGLTPDKITYRRYVPSLNQYILQ